MVRSDSPRCHLSWWPCCGRCCCWVEAFSQWLLCIIRQHTPYLQHHVCSSSLTLAVLTGRQAPFRCLYFVFVAECTEYWFFEVMYAAGHAVRVPLTNSSITDAVFEVKTRTSAEAVNDLLREAANTYLKDILQVRCPAPCLTAQIAVFALPNNVNIPVSHTTTARRKWLS